jgi:hypothetical protein
VNLVPSVPYKSSIYNNNYHECFMEGGRVKGAGGGEEGKRGREKERGGGEERTQQ